MDKKSLILISSLLLSGCNDTGDAKATNLSPVLIGAPQTSIELNQAYRFKPVATDPNGDRLIFSIENKPEWAEFNQSTGELSGDTLSVGHFNDIRISASDGELISSIHFSIHVYSGDEGNRAPVIEGLPESLITIGDAFSFTPTISDPNGDDLQKAVSNLPSWMSFNSETNEFSGVANEDGVYPNITLIVSDGELTSTLVFSVQVVADVPVENTAPSLSGEPLTRIYELENYHFAPQATDADGDTLSFAISNQPSWASFDSETGVLQGIPTEAGLNEGIVISVSDGIDTVALPAFSIDVLAVTRDVALTWQAPTEDSNGGNIEALQGYKIYYGQQAGIPDQIVNIPNASQTSYTVQTLTRGEYFFYMTAIDQQGHESALSEAFRFVVE